MSRRACLLLLLFSIGVWACGDLWMEPLPSELPAPACEEGEELDPVEERCLPATCRSDEHCKNGERCDRIQGRCLPSCEEGEDCPAPPEREG